MDYCKFHIIMQLFSKTYFISLVGVKNDWYDFSIWKKKLRESKIFKSNKVMLKWDIILLIFLQCVKDKKVKHVLHD